MRSRSSSTICSEIALRDVSLGNDLDCLADFLPNLRPGKDDNLRNVASPHLLLWQVRSDFYNLFSCLKRNHSIINDTFDDALRDVLLERPGPPRQFATRHAAWERRDSGSDVLLEDLSHAVRNGNVVNGHHGVWTTSAMFATPCGVESSTTAAWDRRQLLCGAWPHLLQWKAQHDFLHDLLQNLRIDELFDDALRRGPLTSLHVVTFQLSGARTPVFSCPMWPRCS